jgi:hypothetical protein
MSASTKVTASAKPGTGPLPSVAPSIVVISKVPQKLKSEGLHVVANYTPVYLDGQGEKHGGDSIYLVALDAIGKIENEIDVSSKVRLHTINGHNGTAVEIIGIEILGFLETFGKELGSNQEPLPIPREVSLKDLVDIIHRQSGIALDDKQSKSLAELMKSDIGKTHLEIRKEFREPLKQ